MTQIPPGSGACCLPNADGITYLKIGPQGRIVGMIGLDKVFQQLYALGRHPQDVTDEELVGMARLYNWIANKPSIEADYAAALRKAYTIFFDRQENQA